LLLRAKTVISESKTLVIKSFYPITSAAIFYAAFNVFTFIAYRNGSNVGASDAINNSSIFIIILLEILLLNDKSDLRKKLLCAIIAFSGIALIGLIK
jgi:drug/metabolite transporter (DMT)-like permease